MAEKKTTKLRKLIESNNMPVITTVAVALQAKMAEAAGFEAVSMAGAAAIAMVLGLSDTGLVTMTEMAENAQRIANSVNIPLIADCDTGFGNALNARRTVQSMIQAGVAGIHVEDQVAPKRCGFTKGKELISVEEAVGKYRAIVDMRNEMDKDFFIIARTDGRTAVGGSLEEAIKRAKAYKEEGGVDAIYVEAVQSIDEIKQIRAAVKGPLFCTTGAINPLPSIQQLKELGLNFILGNPISDVGNVAIWDMLVAIKQRGPEVLIEWQRAHKNHPLIWPNFFDLVGFPEVQKLEQKYLPAEAQAKYDKSQGIYDPRTRK